MIIVCGWCGKDMGEKEPKDDPSVTHGICDLCQVMIAKEYERLEEKQRRPNACQGK